MKAIVTGISGQDGYFAAERLLADGWAVLGLTSSLSSALQKNSLGNESERLAIHEFDFMKTGNFAGVMNEYDPDLICNFAAKATGQGMFDNPYEMNRINAGFVVDILEAIRTSNRCKSIRFLQASSSEMYGHVTDMPQSEITPFRPKSPYGAAKLYAHNMVAIYRETYSIQCCSAILYNHESIRRSTQFVTKKIANAVARIKSGELDVLTLGALDAKRDWGYAPEYVDAMLRMVFNETHNDYVVATGKLTTIRRLCEIAFESVGLDYHDYVQVNPAYLRPIESTDLVGNPSKIRDELGWVARKSIEEIMIEMVEYELGRIGCSVTN